MSDNIGGGAGQSRTLQIILSEAVAGGVTLIVLWVTSRWIQKLISPLVEDNQQQKKAQKAVIERLLRAGADPARLDGMTQWEVTIAQELVFPEDIEGGMDTIGGLDDVKQILVDDILTPLERPDLFEANPLLKPPRGILLYGPPGTGKTSLAKALAKQSGINFLCISPSSLLSKWVGDTQQLTRAIFSLASRVEPCIIFIDEIDALFRERSSGDHEVYRDMKAEFMQLWDGLFSTTSCQTIVIGCTNRPWDVDPAIQRRLPRSIKVDLPDWREREKILTTVLADTPLHSSIDLARVARECDGYSGSDLRELCRCALMIPMREKLRGERRTRERDSRLRALRTDDLLQAFTTVNPTSTESERYREVVASRHSDGGAYALDLRTPEDMLRDLMIGASALATQRGGGGAGAEADSTEAPGTQVAQR